MRIIDLHCYPSTQEWIDCQGPYVDALAKYWKREWSAKTEAEVILDEDEIGISPGQACVFYSKNEFGDKVLGGGWIDSTVNKYLST